MNSEARLKLSLLLMRITVFAVMLVWTLDKFLYPEHSIAIFDKYYFIEIGSTYIIYLIGLVELLLLLGFLSGIARKYTYGAVLLFHAISTLASFPKYLDPYSGSNALFFAAWPMLAACLCLFLLRDRDTLFSAGG